MGRSIKQHYLVFLIVIGLASIFLLWQLFRPGLFVSDDGDWMVIRLSAFYQSFREGQFPVRFIGRLNNSYGYPVSNFLYPGFLYVGSILHFIGFTFVDCIKVLFGASVLLGAYSLFFWLLSFVSPPAALVGVLSFLFSPYLAFDIYKRGSVGEVLALGVASFCLLTLERRWYALFVPAVAFLLISHNSLALLFFPLFLIIFLSKKDEKGFLSLLLSLGLASFFLIPALLEKKFVHFDQVSVSNPNEYFAFGHYAALLSIPTLLASIWIAFLKKERQIRVLYVGFTLAATLLALPLSQYIWGISSFSKLFQFPYRMLAIPLVFGAYAVSELVEWAKKKEKIILVICFLILWSIPLIEQQRTVLFENHPLGYYTTNEGTTTVANEYMPRWVKEAPTERTTKRLVFIKGRGIIVEDKTTTQTVIAHLTTMEESILQLNSIYYPGWGVTVDNFPVKLSYNNVNGLIRFPVPAGNHTVMAQFRETIPRFLADCVSLVSLGIYIVFFITHTTQRQIAPVQATGTRKKKQNKMYGH